MQKTLILFLFPLILLACNSDKMPEDEHASEPAVESIQTKAIDNQIEDTFVYDTLIYPADDQLNIAMLSVGSFHGDDVIEGADTQLWYGLFKGADSFYIARTDIVLTAFYDAMMDEGSTDSSGIEVSVQNRDTCILLVAELANLRIGKVEAAIYGRTVVFPEDTISLNCLSNSFSLLATGQGEKPEQGGWYPVRNYKLFLKASLGNQEVEHLLVAQPYFDDVITEILFAGDLDGDGILDFIIDTSNKYSWSRPTLYLSTHSKSKQIAVPVGGHTQTSC